jgi:hypothetical protein
MNITHPCGHDADFESSCIERDRFRCPACGLRWRVRTGPARLLPSGFVMPGDRSIEIESRTIPKLTPEKRRKLRGFALSMKPSR